MSNRFDVKIHAIDDFTKTFRNLNNQASKAVRPLVNVQRQVGALSREMHLDKAAKMMGKVSEGAVTLSRTLGLSLGPLEGVMGAGGVVGGLLAAGGAVVALGVRTASTGFEVARTSQAIGVSTKDLQLWRGAMQLAGVDADVATQTLASLGRTLQDARFGRDVPALNALGKLGIGIPMKNGVVDQVAALDGIARAMSRIDDAQVRARLADVLHIPPEALPALIQGAENLDKLRQKAKKFGVDLGEDGIKNSNEFTTSLNLLKVAIEGASNSMGSKFIPTMTEGLDYFTRAIVQSKKTPVESAGGGMWDFATAGPKLVWYGTKRLLSGASNSAFGPSYLVPHENRIVSGPIGGPLSAGAYPEGIKRNNPGNLRSWGGVPTEGGFAKFATPGDGLSAMGEQLGLYGSRGINTPRSIISTYAPPSESDTASYIDDVSKETGFSSDQQLDLSDRETLTSMLKAMVRHEQGRQPFSDGQYRDSAVQAIQLHVHAPPGTKVTARATNQSGAPVSSAYQPTLTQYAMPSGDMP